MANYAYWATSLTGGGDGALDNIEGSTLADGDIAIAALSTDKMYFYRLDATSGAAESSPGIIAPDSNPGTKRWIQTDLYSRAVEYLLETETDFTAADTTPSVSAGYLFNVPAAVTISNFDDPPASGTKLIEIIAGADNVIIEHDAAKIKLNGGLNVLLNTGDSMLFRYVSGVWVERSRSLL